MNIRKAQLKDAKTIQILIKEYAQKELMLARSLNDIYENIRDFCVCEINNNIVGCCALHIVWENLAEIRSLVVNKDNMGKGIGNSIVKFVIEEGKKIGVNRFFVLTYKQNFFEKLDFKLIEKEKLPHKIWSDCIKCVKFPDCDEIAMIYEK